MIGSLLDLTASTPDIAYVGGICPRFQSDPRFSHLAAFKQIIKYIHGTSEFGVLYPYDTIQFLLVIMM